MKKPKKKSVRYANVENPSVAAIVSEMYRFATEEEAAKKLAALSKHFVTPAKQPPFKRPSLMLWIKGYGLEEGDAAAGVIGHFAAVSIKEIGGKFALAASKKEVPARDHPQRAQVRRDNPNWGHPVLRAVRKEKLYHTPEEAQAELALLHEHFPSVSIPTPKLLYIMIYCADRPAKQRMVKFILSVEPKDGKGFIIACKENPGRKQLTHKRPPSEAPKGKFTAKIALARSRKKKKTSS